MFQLIIVVLAIALASTLLMVSVKYLPWWNRTATLIEESTRSSLVQLEQAYDIAARANNGTPPARTLSPDGGYEENFRPILRLMPKAPGNSVWVYGQHPADGGLYANMHYFCLKATGTGADEPLWRGVNRAKGAFSDEQAFISNEDCDRLSSVSLPSVYPAPLFLTYFVAYVPGIDK